ncbi:HEPN domain-containing protein [Candidatus Parcubacteria bacterium]|nr:MAG: HEPN domain-containing protein [Candidatus Parcubacteria bacterium]
MNPITKAWLESAKLDLECIQHIITEEHLTSVVAFHAQQAIEKSFKAVVEEYKHEIGKTHNLIKLYEIASKYVSIDIDIDLLTTLNDLYIDSRYPGNLGLLPKGKPSIADAQEFYELAKHIYNCIESELMKTNDVE